MSPTAGFALVYVGAAAIALVASAIMWRRREAPAARAMASMLLGATLWAICDAIELYLPDASGKLFISQVQYLGVVSAAPFFFHAAMWLAGQGARLTRPVLAAVWGIPILTLAFAWTNRWHSWVWTGIELPAGELPFSIYRYGWWFWVLTAQHYVLMVAATLVLLRSMRRVSRGFRAGMVLVLLAVVLPWIGNAAYNLKLGPWPGLNWLTLSLGISGWLLVWVVVREGILDLLPHAEHALAEMMDEAVLVLDWRGSVIYANNAAREKLELDAPELAAAFSVPTLETLPTAARIEAQVNGQRHSRWLDISVGPVLDRWGGVAGRLVVARDITEQKSIDTDRLRLIGELQSALGKLRQLEGLLPICANCRKVRDDKGYWEKIEDYVGRHAAVEFTHSICQDCANRLYPELSDGRQSERWKI